MEDRKKTFGLRLQEAMQKKGMKAAHLADISGVDRGSISRFINKGYYPQPETMDKLCKALGVSYAWLSGVEDEVLSYIKENKKPEDQAKEDFLLLQKWHKLSPSQQELIEGLIDECLGGFRSVHK